MLHMIFHVLPLPLSMLLKAKISGMMRGPQFTF